MKKDLKRLIQSKGCLYHYTTLESLLKILDSGMLKFGALPRMNDITETSKEYYLEDVDDIVQWNNIDHLSQRVHNIGQISFSQDEDDTEDVVPGYALHAMWGHYADCGEGCCLVFDKSRIIAEVKRNDYHFGKVIYDGANNRIHMPKYLSVDEFITNEYEKLFFHKRKEWEHEQEYRVINLNCDHAQFNGLDIDKSIVAVIFHTNCRLSVFDCNKIQKYLTKLGNIPALEYHYSMMWGNNKGNLLIDSNGNNLLDELANWKIDI